ncbi:acetyl-CoA carboxylase, carboxyltransferase subunit beta [Thermophilibacter provencensis]|uniref:Multifunctional fusion protein n=1 Tax=Thermophilibacter provencensis TaxID=1852386 RepID=A0A921GHW4_9ACTN|nr:acetyl-CoA carboxylase, carboxyltransferase subunit beta [Thermophilibacter provencensis]HJF46340.1 acetyl-CoA carboxylase, carboxyltransferase subunit beta [Thermophilibacter provencensis]
MSKREKSVNALEGPITEVSAEFPERHILVKCPGCRRVIDQSKFDENLDVCPRCGRHLRVSGRKRMRMTVDAGTFEEWDRELAATDFLEFPGYVDKLEAAREKSHENDAVVCGRGKIGGHDAALFFMNAEFMMGSMGSVVGEKITRAFERATELGLPVVGFTVSGGARMQEGTTSLMQMAKVSAAVRRHSEEGLFYLTVLTDPTTGGVTASFAMEGDVILAEPGALVGFAGPRVVEQTTHKKLPAGFQRSEFLLEHGFCDLIVERKDMVATIAELLALHKGKAPAPGAPHALTHEEPRRGRGVRPKRVAEPESAYDIVKLTRSTERATALELLERGWDGFVELHGDRLFADDAAIVAGIGWRGGRVMTVIAIERGSSTKERVRRNFGMAHPEGYRKALRLMRQAEKFGRPVVCLVDTSGAYCGIGAEERGQGEAIAANLVAMSGLRVPIVSAVVGEGGSGGALGLAVADRVYMLGSAAYSVVSPEGCASILWKDPKRADDAAAALHITAEDLTVLGLVDGVINDIGLTHTEIAHDLVREVELALDELDQLDADQLVGLRYDKFRAMGGDRICSRS